MFLVINEQYGILSMYDGKIMAKNAVFLKAAHSGPACEKL